MKRILIGDCPLSEIIVRSKYSTAQVDLYQCGFTLKEEAREKIRTVFRDYVRTAPSTSQRPSCFVGNLDIYFLKIPNQDAQEIMKNIMEIVGDKDNQIACEIR